MKQFKRLLLLLAAMLLTTVVSAQNLLGDLNHLTAAPSFCLLQDMLITVHIQVWARAVSIGRVHVIHLIHPWVTT